MFFLKKYKKPLLVVSIIFFISLIFNSLRPKKKISYTADVKPILNSKCISCHGGVKKNGGLSFLFRDEAIAVTQSGKPAIIPGSAKKSELIKRLHETDLEERMPYRKPKLSDKEIEILTKWIDQGAKWGTHWAYIMPEKQKIPEVSKKYEELKFLYNPIDNFIAARMEDVSLFPNKTAPKNLIARRAAFDVTGLPPEKNIYDNFLDNKISYEQYLDKLFENLGYGENWASWWLDFARYADTNGFEADRTRSIWRYRDWVINALNHDKPFDEFTIEQLAGDLLPNPSVDQFIATAFHRNTMTNQEGGTDDEEYRVAAIIDRVNTTFDALQSTTMSCVQCHSHPYDPIRHKEYYEVMAFFNNTVDSDHNHNEPRLRILDEKLISKSDKVIKWISNYGSEEEKKIFERFITFIDPVYYANQFEVIDKKDAYFLTSYLGFRNGGEVLLKNANSLKNRVLYFSNFVYQNGVTITFRKNSSNGRIIGKVKLDKDKNPDISTEGYDSQKVTAIKIPQIEGSFDLYISAKTSEKIKKSDVLLDLEWISFLPEIPGKNKPGYSSVKNQFIELLSGTKFSDLHPVTLENPKHMSRKTFMFDRGNWMTPKEEVKPKVPSNLNDWEDQWEKNRLGFAKWITSEKNPLTARTVVNRIWYQIFGRGIVNTIEDMGTQSEAPSHPALLDWLSYEFMTSMNWSLKKLIKTILLSSTYRQSSIIPKEKISKDPDNVFYARGPRIRLTAEQIRDQALFISGLLSKKMYGPGVMPPQPDGIWESPYNGDKWIESKGADKYRRALYTFVKRTSPYPSMSTFDVNMREVCYVKRIPTNTPLQALVTLNDPVYLEAALSFAKLHSKKPYKEAIKDMFEFATYRELSEEKLNSLVNLYKESSEYYAKSPEGLSNFYLENKKVSNKVASLAIIASAIMNLDEFLTHG